MQAAFLLIYTFLYIVALIFLIPKKYLKRPANIRKRWIMEKLGFFKESFSQSSNFGIQPKIWIHAVSVGEIIAVSGLIKRLAQDYEIILSTITDTGQKIAFQRFKDYPVKVIYLPFDIPCAINRTLRFFKPSILILTETELWPNLIFLSSKKIPVILVNGRLSEKSFKGYRKLKFFFNHLLKKLSLLCVQEDSYKERFINIGAEDRKIYVTGNMKFDIELKETSFIWESSIIRPVILAGSTHKPEEEIILDAFLNLDINGTLILTPRHPERFSEVESIIKTKIAESNREILFLKLSEITSAFSLQPKTLILLVDQMGILDSLYRVCDLAIIGGSFIPHGGQNPLEPAYWKKPIVCGPYMYNFPFIEEFIKEKACRMVDSINLQNSIKELLEKPEIMASMGAKAYEILSKKAGATEKTLKQLKKLIAYS